MNKITITLLLIISIITFISLVGATDITSCMNITSAGIYNLTGDINTS